MSEKNEAALRAALAQAEQQGDPDAVRRAEKQLAAAGYKKAAARERQVAAKDDEGARKRAPRNRSAPKRSTATTTDRSDAEPSSDT